MDKKTILALVLSALILFTWQAYMSKHYPDARLAGRPAAEPGEASEGSPARVQDAGASVGRFQGTIETIEELSEARPRKAPIIPPEEIEIETEKYVVTLSNEGGYIKSIVLREYPDPTTNEMFKLVDAPGDIFGAAEGVFAINNFGGYDLSTVRFTTEKKYGEVIFSARLDNGLEVTKKYIFPNSLYHIDLEVNFRNTSGKALQVGSYTIIAGSNIDIPSKIDRRYAQVVSDISGSPRRDRGKKGEGVFVNGIVNYTGLQNKYFSLIAKTSTPTKGISFKELDSNNILTQIEIDKFIINQNSGVTHNFLLYAGPSKPDIMKQYDLASAISYGFFGGISKALLAGLKFFHRVFRNWGVAVILLSVCVNLILFPLSRKSYGSMKKMQELQPHMEKLRGEHKDNPQKLNKEMMELYKKYNVNPMGGCLPLLLQMPIFFSLYTALMRSLELRGARFLWIKDLSMPDAVYHLPSSMPLIGSSINILPILMAGAMIAQQKIATQRSSAASDQMKQQQQMMMIMMPVLFLFIMYNFPSGLVLYWLTNTLLTMFEQRAIMRA